MCRLAELWEMDNLFNTCSFFPEPLWEFRQDPIYVLLLEIIICT